MMLGRELTPWQTPLSHWNSLQREMNELFPRFFGEGEQAGAAWASPGMGYIPPIESWVRDHTYYIKADLPGMDPEDVEVTMEGNRLTLRGERKAAHEGKEGNSFHREVRYGSFVRTLTIPEGIKAEDVQASYRNGVLELAMPLPAAMVPKKVNIEVESQANGRKQVGAPK